MKRSLLLSLALMQMSCAARKPAYTQEEVRRQEPWVCRVLSPRNQTSQPSPSFDSHGNPVAAVAAIAVVAVAFVGLGATCVVTRLPRLFEAKPVQT